MLPCKRNKKFAVSRPKNIVRDENAPSKSQLKRDMTALQDLGEVLGGLSKSQLDELDLPETLRDALDDLPKVTAHEGRRRHIQYIGKLMRHVDPAPIREQIDRWEIGSRANKTAFKMAEKWRDRLIAEPKVLADFAELQPEVDTKALAALIEKARLQAARDEAPAASRQVFRVVYKAFLKVPTSAGANGPDALEP
jgi:ribosome-associated protein